MPFIGESFSIEAKPRYLRSLQPVAALEPASRAEQRTVTASTPKPNKPPQRARPVYADRGQAKVHLRMVWPIACRRLEGLPNISATQLFEELCQQFPGRFTRVQYKTILQRVDR